MHDESILLGPSEYRGLSREKQTIVIISARASLLAYFRKEAFPKSEIVVRIRLFEEAQMTIAPDTESQLSSDDIRG